MEDKRFCILCEKELIARELTCSKECAKQYIRISQRLYNKLFSGNKKCIICGNKLNNSSKLIICSDNCSNIFDKIINHLKKRIGENVEDNK